MIKFSAGNEGNKIIGLGLSRKNVEKLMEGLPIIVKGREINRPEVGEILVFFGETEEQMVADLELEGLLDKNTVVHKSKNPN